MTSDANSSIVASGTVSWLTRWTRATTPVDLALFAVGIHGHQTPQAWSETMPHVVHVHGKFFDIREPVAPMEGLLRVLVANGYTCYGQSECEGRHWNTESDAFDMVARQQALCRRVLDGLAARRQEGASA